MTQPNAIDRWECPECLAEARSEPPTVRIVGRAPEAAYPYELSSEANEHALRARLLVIVKLTEGAKSDSIH